MRHDSSLPLDYRTRASTVMYNLKGKTNEWLTVIIQNAELQATTKMQSVRI
jgi:hypothetical protein